MYSIQMVKQQWEEEDLSLWHDAPKLTIIIITTFSRKEDQSIFSKAGVVEPTTKKKAVAKKNMESVEAAAL